VSGDASEFADLVASAKVVVEELLEEGVDRFDRLEGPDLGPEPIPDPESAPSPPSLPPGDAPSPLARSSAEPVDPANWGPAPSLEDVRGVLGDCQRCGLCEGRKNIVFGDGNPNADLLFVGEGPGEQEDLRGLPFVGRAGELLTQMIEKGLGISRQDVYICNVVKCRPPGNRDPLPTEVAACNPFLDGQIAAVAPKVIVSLGKPAASLLLGRNVAITRERGSWHTYRGIPLMLTLHPAFVLRRYTEANRRAVWEDLKAALGRAREARGS
jgi:DNA polymerase